MVVGGCTLYEFKTFIMVLSVIMFNSRAVNLVLFLKT